jgi:hypothetical protein
VDNGGHRVVYGRNGDASHNAYRPGYNGDQQHNNRYSGNSNYESILRNKPVDKNEIKSALEKKLDMFDGIDDKYAEWAKQTKEQQPEVADDKNLAKNELIDEALQ